MMKSTRQDFDGLFSLYLAIGIAVALIVFAAVAFAAIRYRDREGRTPSRRSQANALELGGAVLITAIVAFLVFRTFSTEAKEDDSSAEPVRLDVTAFQWGWRFDYPGQGVSVIGDSNHEPVLGVPAGRRVSFALTSRDVIHAFWIPSERFKRDAFPDRTNRFDLVFDQPGGHEGVCAEFCGLRHTNMRFRVLVLGSGDFRRWLAVQRSRMR
jgi:cytochrome c oxidase subunit II